MLTRTPVPKAERMRRKESKTTPLYLVRGRLGFRYCSLLLQRWLSSWNWIVTASTCIRGTHKTGTSFFPFLCHDLEPYCTLCRMYAHLVCSRFGGNDEAHYLPCRNSSSCLCGTRYRDKVTANIFFFIPILIEKIGEDGNEVEKLFHIVGPTDIDCTKNCNRYILKFELDSISRDSIVFLCEIASPINLFRTFKIISILREILFIFERSIDNI